MPRDAEAVLEERLAEGLTLEDLVAAVEGAHASPYNREPSRRTFRAIFGTEVRARALAEQGWPVIRARVARDAARREAADRHRERVDRSNFRGGAPASSQRPPGVSAAEIAEITGQFLSGTSK